MKITEAQKIAYQQRLTAALAACRTLEEWSYTVSREFAYEGMEIDTRSTSVSWLGRGKEAKIHRIRALCERSLGDILEKMSFDDVFLVCKTFFDVVEGELWPHDIPIEPKMTYEYYDPAINGVVYCYRCFLLERHATREVFDVQRSKLVVWRLDRANWILHISEKYSISQFLLRGAKTFSDCRRVSRYLHTGRIGDEIFAKMCSLAANADEHFTVASMAKRRGDEVAWKKHVKLCAQAL